MSPPCRRTSQGYRPSGRPVVRRRGVRRRYSPTICLVTWNSQWSPDMNSTTSKNERVILYLDELEGYHDETFGRSRATSGDDSKLPRHIGLARHVSKSFSPKVIRGAELGNVSLKIERNGEKNTHNFVARLGASSSSGGTRPCLRQVWSDCTALKKGLYIPR